MGRKLVKLRQMISVSLLIAAPAVSTPGAEQIGDFVKIQTFKTHGRVSLRLDASVEAERQKTDTEASQGIEVLLKGVGLADLGAPFGAEGEWLRQLDRIGAADPRIAKIELRELEQGVLFKARWKFPSGKSALARAAMDSFHYRKDESYVVDFWLKPGPTVIQARAAAERRASETRLRRFEKGVRERGEHRRALAQARAEMEDSLRFCREPWSEKREVFLPFLPARSSFAFDRYFPRKAPDEDYPYSEPKGDSEEAQYFRLAIKLYRKQKYALVQKTLDFFDRRFKESPLAEESAFLRANAMLKMGFEEPAMVLLKGILARNGAHPASLHSGMFLALRKHKAGDMLGAFEQFMWLSQTHAAHRLAWVFRMGVAESLAGLKQTPRAAQEYRWVMENAPDRASQVEGAVRIGDLHLERRQYDQALASYFLATQEFPGELDRFPSFWINRAESLYWLGQYERATAAFEEFQKKFAAHPAAWRAAFRLSELAGRRGEESRAQELMVETINRYPYSPGATLARARVMGCSPGQRPGVEAIQAFFGKEFPAFSGDGQVLLDRFGDYRGLAHVRALLAAGAEETAIGVALDELDGRSENPAKVALARMLEHLFRRSILKRLGDDPSDASRLSALSYYHELAPRIPHFPGNVDSDYLFKLSQSAIELGMAAWGQELAQSHLARAGGDRALAASSGASFDRRLLDSEKAFTEARARWISGVSDESAVAAIRSLLQRVVEESPFSYEKELLTAVIESRAARPALALTHLLKAQALAPAAERNAPRILFLLATLHSSSGNSNAAIEAFRQLRKAETGDSERLAQLGLPVVPDAQTLLLKECEELSRLKRWGDIATLLGGDEGQGTLGSPLKYQLALALGRTGRSADRKKSAEILKSLADGAPEEFWKNLAREALNNPKVNAKEGIL